jgi:hypothetical protein
MNTKLGTVLLLAVLGTTAAPSIDANAYVLNASLRPAGTTTLLLNPWVELLLPDYFDALEDADAKMDVNPSNQRFSLINDNDVAFSVGNGESEVNFTTDPALLCGSIGCTTTISLGGVIIESDVNFSSSYAWTVDDLKANSKAYNGPARPLLNTALHEFSHAMGLDHEGTMFNILGNAWTVVNTNGSVTETVISEDTSEGLIAAYGLRASVSQDLSLYHWEWSGTGAGGSSIHARTPILDAGGAALAAAPASDPVMLEPAWYVSNGQTIQIRQTAENRGTSQTVTIKWYMSTNSTITTFDTELASSSIAIGRNTPYTWNRTLTLPNTLNSGDRRWVGAIIDTAGIVAEQNEINNAIYVAEIEVL